VLDVQPVGNPQPAPQPVISDSPTYTSTPTPVVSNEPAPAASAGQRSYTIKKGDTLYGIAVAHYGDGKQWTRIANANPGIDPSRLMVGKTIIIP
jgi:5'-nucleotidase